MQRALPLTRSFHTTVLLRMSASDATVTPEELKKALTTRLSATHTVIKDVSGNSFFPCGVDVQEDVGSHMKLSL